MEAEARVGAGVKAGAGIEVKIAVASGKGGTGKTMVAVSFARAIARSRRVPVLVSDCDVEAPNAGIFLSVNLSENRDVLKLVPRVDEKICSGCGTCAEVCQFNAILVLGDQPVVFPALCHGCGSCTLTCPENAIREIPQKIGALQRGQASADLTLRQGLLDVGQPLAVPVIASLLKWDLPTRPELEIRDCPPGASCPVVEAVRGSDFVLLVTEPTPFGLHDLKAAYQVTRELGLPAGVILNRVGIGEADIKSYCRDVRLPMLLEIPLETRIGAGLARGDTLLDIHPEYEPKFEALLESISDLVGEDSL